jgi:hypothetical protein
LIRYLHNTPLWFDEAVYTVDIINRSFEGLFQPSDYYTQTGSLVFFLLYKGAVSLLGTSEYALRSVSLATGALSVWLFYIVSKDILGKGALLISLLLFAVLDPLIYYSTEFKTYSLDVTVALLVLLLMRFHGKTLKLSDTAVMVLIGSVAIISSNPALFMLAGVGTGLLLSSIRRKHWRNTRLLFGVFVFWILSFVAIYMVYMSTMKAHMAEKIGLAEAMQMEKFFMPFPPRSLTDMKWFIDFFFDTFLFQDPIMYVKKVTASGLMAFSFLAGSAILLLEKRDHCLMLLLPIAVTLFASMMQMYPFKGRLILFLIPVFLIIIGAGAEYIRKALSGKSLFIGAAFLLLLFIYPLSWAAYHVKQPVTRSYIRPVLQYIENGWQEGDILYVHFFSQFETLYYLKYSPSPVPLEDGDYVIGIGPRGWYNKWNKDKIPDRYVRDGIESQTDEDLKKEYIRDLQRIRGYNRVWVLFTGDTSKEHFFLSYLDTIGTRTDTFGESGKGITYLYNLHD